MQTTGRARNVDGQVVMYADRITDSMQKAIDETSRRRALQTAYNEEHGIDPQTIRKAVSDILSLVRPEGTVVKGRGGKRKARSDFAELPREELSSLIRQLEEEMHLASSELRFEEAARIRDELAELKQELQAVR